MDKRIKGSEKTVAIVRRWCYNVRNLNPQRTHAPSVLGFPIRRNGFFGGHAALLARLPVQSLRKIRGTAVQRVGIHAAVGLPAFLYPATAWGGRAQGTAAWIFQGVAERTSLANGIAGGEAFGDAFIYSISHENVRTPAGGSVWQEPVCCIVSIEPAGHALQGLFSRDSPC